MNFLELFEKKSLIAAHRGASSSAPENTLLAMKKSVGRCDFIEIDVQLSSDGVAVILHDKRLDRTTNIKELTPYKNRFPYNVSDFTYDELNILDFGEGENLLTLKRALEFIKENLLYLNIEIKDVSDSFSDEKIVSTVLEDIKNAGVENQVLVSSFRAEYLTLVKKLSPNMAMALLAYESNHENLIEYLNDLGVDAYHINKKLVNRSLVKRLKAEGIFVSVYVVNDKKEQKRFFDMGVKAVFSDLSAT
ncbi:MAG: glycerophosphodiester phosphodiesterase family protein [Campylobacterota bacterium]